VKPELWDALLDLQNKAAYGEGVSHDSPNTVNTLRHVQAFLEAMAGINKPVRGPTLVIGPGGGTEVGFALEHFPSPIVFVTAHLPEFEVLQHRVSLSSPPTLTAGVCVDDMHELKFAPTGYFGFVFANNVLEHCIAPYAALMQIRRVLQPGGVARIVVPSFEGPEGGNGPFHLHCQRSDEWVTLMAKCGFRQNGIVIQRGVDAETDHYQHYCLDPVELQPPHDAVLRAITRIHEEGR
jgi:SAM-dependent methyltransferase